MNHRMSLIALGATTLVFTWLLAGCGDYDDDPAAGGDTDTDADTDTDTDTDTDADADAHDLCDNVTPCGGDVVGTWNVTGSCLAVSGVLDTTSFSLGDTCNATITGSIEVTGTWTANGDGTYSDGTTVTGSETVEMSSECKELSGTETICSRLEGPFEAGGYDTISILDNNVTGGCTASVTINQAGGIGVAPGFPSTSGVYTISGNTLTITEGQAYSYCVSGNTLTMTPVSTGLTGTITGSVVLQRQ